MKSHPLLNTDIIIRRVSNGWIVFSGSEYEENRFITTVYEDSTGDWADSRQSLGGHEALICLIREHFPEYLQCEKQGGIKLEIRSQGYASEAEDEKR